MYILDQGEEKKTLNECSVGGRYDGRTGGSPSVIVPKGKIHHIFKQHFQCEYPVDLLWCSFIFMSLASSL